MKVARGNIWGIIHAGWHSFATRFLDGPSLEQRDEGCDLVGAVEQAHREWLAAKSLFETVTDPDLIDYAIYYLQATQKRFVYLLRQAQDEGIRTENWQ